MNVQTFHHVLIGALCLAATVLGAVTYNHHQDLAALQAAAAQVRPDPTPTLRHDLEGLRDRQTTLQAELRALATQQDAVLASHAGFRQDLDRLGAAIAERSQPSGDVISSEVVTAWQQRLDTVETTLAQVQRHLAAQAVAASPPAHPKSTTAAKPTANAVRLTRPPLSLLGVEVRGSAQFLSVLPAGEHSLSAVQLLQPGDSVDGWQLRTIQRDHAVFHVAGHADRRLPLP